MSVHVSLRGMLRLIRVDTLGNVVFSRGTALMHITITEIDLNLLPDTKYDSYLSMYTRYKYV